jgi:hypothetical protein
LIVDQNNRFEWFLIFWTHLINRFLAVSLYSRLRQGGNVALEPFTIVQFECQQRLSISIL